MTQIVPSAGATPALVLVRRAHRGLCCGRRHLLLGLVLRRVLAQEPLTVWKSTSVNLRIDIDGGWIGLDSSRHARVIPALSILGRLTTNGDKSNGDGWYTHS